MNQGKIGKEKKHMTDELRRLVWDVSSKDRMLNDREILKVLDMKMQEQDLKAYLKKVSFLSLNGVNACYHPVKKQLIIDAKNMRNNINLQFSHIDFWPIEKVILYHNLMIVQTLFHEIEHMEQYRKAKSKLSDYESRLLRLCYSATLYYERHRKEETIIEKISKEEVFSYFDFESDYYMEDPRERMAQIRSHQQILKLIRSFYKESADIYRYEQNELNFEKIRSYKFINDEFVAPTIAFLSEMERKEVLKIFKADMECKKLLNESLRASIWQTSSLEERLLFGLPIHMEEYYEESKKLVF